MTAGSFTCPCCGATSDHPQDVEHGYCPACHWWTGDPQLGPPHVAEPCAARDAASRLQQMDAWLPGDWQPLDGVPEGFLRGWEFFYEGLRTGQRVLERNPVA